MSSRGHTLYSSLVFERVTVCGCNVRYFVLITHIYTRLSFHFELTMVQIGILYNRKNSVLYPDPVAIIQSIIKMLRFKDIFREMLSVFIKILEDVLRSWNITSESVHCSTGPQSNKVPKLPGPLGCGLAFIYNVNAIWPWNFY